jgi:DNA modification methylase
MYKNMTGQPVPEQVEAFCDAWTMDEEKELIARSIPVLLRDTGVADEYVAFWKLWMNSLRKFNSPLMAYLIYMVPRLCYMKKILKPTGSIYLHCDPTASHYLKIMMDGIFGYKNFRSEIIWRRTNSHNKLSTQYGPIHDTVFFYSCSDKMTFHPGTTPYSKAYIESRFKYSDKHGRYQLNYLTGPGERKGESGKEWRGFAPTSKGRHWAIPKSLRAFLDDGCKTTIDCLECLYKKEFIVFPKKDGGQPMYKQYVGGGITYQDIWAYQPNTKGVLIDKDVCIDEDVKYLENEEERLGYPTQKPVGLLKRIIESSSNPGDIVFDPFCGCGTTVYAAQELGRKWVGCDIAILAVKLVRDILRENHRLIEGLDFVVDGIPRSIESAIELAKHNRFQFQHWIVERVGGFPIQKKTGDQGIDGKLFFPIDDKFIEMVLSVKSGHIKPADIRELRGTLEREENAEMAGFLCINEPTKAMRHEAAAAGHYEHFGNNYPRIQILTVREIIEDKKVFCTPTALRSKVDSGQLVLGLDW